MRWDPKRRRYIDSHGRVIPPREVRKEVIDYISSEQAHTVKEAQKLLDGTITVSRFFYFMQQKINAWHDVAGSIAYGGKLQMDKERHARIRARIDSELSYLAEFRKQVKDSFDAARLIAQQAVNSIELVPVKSFIRKPNATAKAQIEKRLYAELKTAAPSVAKKVVKRIVEEMIDEPDAVLVAEALEVDAGLAAKLIGATIPSRAAMYSEAAYATFQNNVSAREFDEGVSLGRRVCLDDPASCDECVEAATEEWVPLDSLPEIGSLQCLNNCRCEFEFKIDGTEFATSEVFQGVVGGQDAYGGSVKLQ